MKFSFRSILAVSIVTGTTLTHADAPIAPPAAPTNGAPAAPAKAAAKKPAAKAPVKAAAKPVANDQSQLPPLLAPEPGASRQNNVNVRGQAKINSESVARLQKGEAVTILEEITLKKPAQDEPARWYRIALPSKVPVWVHSSFIDTATATVKVKKLNLRGGPGENFSILGALVKGDAIKAVDNKGEWVKIETPTNAFGFVAAHLVERTPGAVAVKPVEVAAVPPVTAAPPTNTPPPVVAEVTPPPATVVPGADVVPPLIPPVVPPAANPPVVAETPVVPEVAPEAPIEKVKKISSREGILKGSASIQAPTYFELRSLDTGRTINYVYSPSTNLLLKEFRGKRIIVTGEELLDERWQNTPVLIVDSLQSVP